VSAAPATAWRGKQDMLDTPGLGTAVLRAVAENKTASTCCTDRDKDRTATLMLTLHFKSYSNLQAQNPCASE